MDETDVENVPKISVKQAKPVKPDKPKRPLMSALTKSMAAKVRTLDMAYGDEDEEAYKKARDAIVNVIIELRFELARLSDLLVMGNSKGDKVNANLPKSETPIKPKQVVIGEFKSQEWGPVMMVADRYASGAIRISIHTREDGEVHELSLDPGELRASPEAQRLATDSFRIASSTANTELCADAIYAGLMDNYASTMLLRSSGRVRIVSVRFLKNAPDIA